MHVGDEQGNGTHCRALTEWTPHDQYKFVIQWNAMSGLGTNTRSAVLQNTDEKFETKMHIVVEIKEFLGDFLRAAT